MKSKPLVCVCLEDLRAKTDLIQAIKIKTFQPKYIVVERLRESPRQLTNRDLKISFEALQTSNYYTL